ncbi:MAG: hypothetical protein P8Y45_11040, partial [Exilibacterium sp.]
MTTSADRDISAIVAGGGGIGAIDKAIKDNAGKAVDSIRRLKELKEKDAESLSLEEKLELAALEKEDVLRRSKHAMVEEVKGSTTSDFRNINSLNRETDLNTTKG